MKPYEQSIWGVTYGYLVVISLICLCMSFPLLFAWSHDPSMRYGLFIFLVWLVAILPQWSIRSSITVFSVLELVLISILLIFGILGALQFPIYIALAMCICVPVKVAKWKLLFYGCSLMWMPLWAWFCMHAFDKSITCINVGVATVITLFSLYHYYFKNEPQTDNSSV